MNKLKYQELRRFLYRYMEGKEQFQLWGYGYLQALCQYKIITKKQFCDLSKEISEGIL
ncbi:MAG: hypothetical protein Q8M94_11655 [Ignavibacteria bacterium]|nr:hypothetical protein [Ignavibacteria bacterium]